MVLKTSTLLLVSCLLKNVLLENNEENDIEDFSVISTSTRRPTFKNLIKDPLFVRIELPLEILSALGALKKSINHLEDELENRQKISDADLKDQLIRIKKEIITETEDNVRQQLAEAQNQMINQMNALEESTKLVFSKSENLTSEIQSNIKSQIQEVKTKEDETEQSLKQELHETKNEIVSQMNALRESTHSAISNLGKELSKTKQEIVAETEQSVRQQLTEAKNDMMGQMRALENSTKLAIANSENLASEIGLNIITQLEEVKANMSSDFDEIKGHLIPINKTAQSVEQKIEAGRSELNHQIKALRESTQSILSKSEDGLLGIESNMQSQFDQIKDLGNELLKTKQVIITEAGQNVRKELTDVKNEMVVQMNALAESIKQAMSKNENLSAEVQSSINIQFKEAKGDISTDFNGIKEQLLIINQTEQSVKQQLAETKSELVDQMSTLEKSAQSILAESGKKIEKIESNMQSQADQIKDLGNELIKTKQAIITEAEENVRKELTDVKNEMCVQINASAESTKLAISKNKNVITEAQSSIKSHFKQMEAKYDTCNSFKEIKNQLTTINEVEQSIKKQLTETKDAMVGQVKSLLSEGEKRFTGMQSNIQTQFKEMNNGDLNEIKNRLTNIQKEIHTYIEEQKVPPNDCKEIQKNGHTTSGIYRIQPKSSSQGFSVWCDMSTRGGGWTYIINRFDGSQNFALNWNDYKKGFGGLAGEHWLGLDHLHELTNNEPTELLIELTYSNSKTAYANYNNFKVGSESEAYRLKSLGSYTGNAGDAFREHENIKFSTMDKDQTHYCARSHEGGWWYRNCYKIILTGKYSDGLRIYKLGLKNARMMIRPR